MVHVYIVCNFNNSRKELRSTLLGKIQYTEFYHLVENGMHQVLNQHYNTHCLHKNMYHVYYSSDTDSLWDICLVAWLCGLQRC